MIESVFEIDLPICEKFSIKRNRFIPNSDIRENNISLKRVSIISGIHGDEIEGQYVCFLLSRWLSENSDKIRGVIDIYPSINSLGVDSITRSIPFYNVDLNRVFPGSKDDFLPAQIANALVESIRGSDIAIDIHSSNIFLKEIPQVRISQIYAQTLVPLAKKLNIDFIWLHDAVTVLEATLAHSLNSIGVKTLVVEMGVGMRLTKEYGQNLLKGILNLMASEGILDIAQTPVGEPIVSLHGEVAYINSPKPGLFVPLIEHYQNVKKGEEIGQIVDPLSGEILENVLAPMGGILFTLREYPIVYEGSLLARIFGGEHECV